MPLSTSSSSTAAGEAHPGAAEAGQVSEDQASLSKPLGSLPVQSKVQTRLMSEHHRMLDQGLSLHELYDVEAPSISPRSDDVQPQVAGSLVDPIVRPQSAFSKASKASVPVEIRLPSAPTTNDQSRTHDLEHFRRPTRV